MVLQSIAHQQFTPSLESHADDAEDSGSDSDNNVANTHPSRKRMPILPAQEASEPEATSDSAVSASSTSVVFKEDTIQCTIVGTIVVTEETSDQVVKEVLQYLHHAFSNVLKQQQVLCASSTSHAESTSSHSNYGKSSSVVEAMQSSVALFSSGGKVLNAMYGLFDDADVKNNSTKGSIVDLARDKDNKKNKNTKAKGTTADKESSSEPPTWLVDTLSGPRTSNVLELLTKVTTQAVRECNVLLKAAQHFRRVCNFIVSTQRQAEESNVKRKERNTFSDSEEDEEEDNFDGEADHKVLFVLLL